MRSKIPKIISGILAIMLIVWLGYALLPPARFWIAFEFVSAVLVAVGCVGELYLFHLPSGRLKREKEKHHHLESRFILAVAVGVTMELFALSHAISEATRLEQDVASANERAGIAEQKAGVANEHAALTDSNNLVLRSNVVALEMQYVQITNNVANLDSSKWPVHSVTAEVMIHFNPQQEVVGDLGFPARLTISHSGNPAETVLLVSSKAFFTGKRGIHPAYSMTFSSPVQTFPVNVPQEIMRGKSAKTAADDLDSISLQITNFPASDAVVTRCSAVIIINEIIRKRFSINPGAITNGTVNLTGTAIPSPIRILNNE